MEGATGPSITIQEHQQLPELNEQFNRIILSLGPRNPLAGPGAETLLQVCRNAERREGGEARLETKREVRRENTILHVQVFAAETRKCGWICIMLSQEGTNVHLRAVAASLAVGTHQVGC